MVNSFTVDIALGTNPMNKDYAVHPMDVNVDNPVEENV